MRDHVSSQIIKDYLIEKTKKTEDCFHMKELNTRKETTHNKCFIIGLDWSLKDDAYNLSFWPGGLQLRDLTSEVKVIF